jgi:acetoin utilization protein AcuB
MTEEIITVAPQTLLATAARTLLQYKIGGLPVLEDEKLVGVITTSDLLKTFIDVAERSPLAIAHATAVASTNGPFGR